MILLGSKEAKNKIMKFNKSKVQSTYLEKRIKGIAVRGDACLDSKICEKDLATVIDHKLTMRQQHDITAK